MCVWHADPKDPDEKTVESLRDARVDVEDRSNHCFDELLDGAVLRGLELEDKLSLDRVALRDADLTDTNLEKAKLGGANLSESDLTNANLIQADLTDVDLSEADLTGAGLNRTKLIRANLFDADLTGISSHGATVNDVQINAGTTMCSEDVRSDVATGLQRLSPPPYCGYDIELRKDDDLSAERRQDLLSKAADTYQTFEKLARENAQPGLQSSMFLLCQDMQRARYRERREYLSYVFSRVSRSVFKHGESLFRIFLWGFLIILTYAAVYARFGLILDEPGVSSISLVDALYFTTLTFTTLGLGDFHPDPTTQLARALVTSQAALGAVLIAVFVFVLGRRASR